MGILDEAIREHLELKRQHGAADSELKQLEDEAFGPADRPGGEPAPDPFAEAPTEFLEQPDAAGEQGEQQGSRRETPSIADLQEPPQPPPSEKPSTEEAPGDEQPAIEHEPAAEAPAAAPGDAAAESEPSPGPSEPEATGHTTEERDAIAEQPTELFDVEEELSAGESSHPSDEELVEQEIAEPRLGPSDPLAALEEEDGAEVSVEGPAAEDGEDDEFWNEQRLSDELNQALEAPVDEPKVDDEPEEPESGELEPEDDAPSPEAPPAGGDEDVLEETPDFLEETPEDDELWFEQKPPKDFDFDD